MVMRVRYSIRLLLALLTVTTIVVEFVANDHKARGRVETVRTMVKEGATPSEILQTLGNPVRIKFDGGVGHGYYAGLDWNACLESSWPFIHLPTRNYVLVECKNSLMFNNIYWKHGSFYIRTV